MDMLDNHTLGVLVYPRRLWELYLEYLVFYEPNSWTAFIARAFRILAIFIIFPIFVFTSLVRSKFLIDLDAPSDTLVCIQDIASYVVARTLGVIDDVKASTSDKETVHGSSVNAMSLRRSDEFTPCDGVRTESGDTQEVERSSPSSHPLQSSSTLAAPDEPRAYFASSEDPQYLKLMGNGLFSPAVSRAASPIISRRELPPQTSEKGLHLSDDDAISVDQPPIRRRVAKLESDLNSAN
ncbi:hypothetical protein FISHEDRAFT_71345 [Fistulina hepatica ATCC 64428]|nr:hypothetical protein FISHEDRAFT_71345 [Fistulina hepatica ATCC 64428]